MVRHKPYLLLVFGLMIFVIGLSQFILTAPLAGPSKAKPKVLIAVADHVLRLEPDYSVKLPSIGRSDPDQINLIAQFPDFRPAGRLNLDKTARQQRIMITLKPIEESRETPPPEERPARLYARYLKPEAAALENGLLQRHFETGSPYESEDLFIAPPDGRAFYARCAHTTQQAEDIDETCFTEMRISGLDVRILFAPEMLAQWQALSDGVRSLIHRALKEGEGAE